MPLIKISTTNPEKNRLTIQQEASRILSEVTGKPESAILVATEKADFIFNREVAGGAFVEIRAIGKIEPDTNTQISIKLCQLLSSQLEIPAENIHLNFMDIPRSNWGHQGGTF